MAVHREKSLAVERVKDVRQKFLAAARHHDRFRKASRIHMAAAEHVDDLVRDHAQPL